MSNAKKLLEYKEKMNAAKEARQRALGALDKLQKELQSDFNCKSKGEADKKLTEIKKRAQKLEKEVDEMEADFEEEFSDLLNL